MFYFDFRYCPRLYKMKSAFLVCLLILSVSTLWASTDPPVVCCRYKRCPKRYKCVATSGVFCKCVSVYIPLSRIMGSLYSGKWHSVIKEFTSRHDCGHLHCARILRVLNGTKVPLTLVCCCFCFDCLFFKILPFPCSRVVHVLQQ